MIALLAFFALRPGKGWLRKKTPPVVVSDASPGKGSTDDELLTVDTFLHPSTGSKLASLPPAHVLPLDPLAQQPLPDQGIAWSAAAVPHSYLTSAGIGAEAAPEAAAAITAGPLPNRCSRMVHAVNAC